jgi:hypothetical protein
MPHYPPQTPLGFTNENERDGDRKRSNNPKDAVAPLARYKIQLVGVHGIHSIEAHKALCCSLPALAKLAWLATGLVALCMNGADITSFSV